MARDFALAAGQQAHNQWLSPLRSRLLEDSLASLEFLHNETCNIYTHLVGALLLPIIADCCMATFSQPRFSGVHGMDYAMFGIFFLSAECCLILSTTYHLIGSYSHSVEQMWLRMDLFGIVIVTTGTFVPSIYYAFPCHPRLQRLYWTIVSHLSPLLAIMFWCLQCTDAETDHRLGMRRCNYDLDTPISTLEDGEDMRLRCSRSLVVHSNAAWNSAIWAQVHAQTFGNEMVFA
jgi:predicted membrane channel-forming protein YqfA (hemolysin III family)